MVGFIPYIVVAVLKTAKSKTEKELTVKITLGTYGMDLYFGPAIPPAAQAALERKMKAEKTDPNKVDLSFGLTPIWDKVPSLSVRSLRKRHVDVPEHWGDTDEVAVLIDGLSFIPIPTWNPGAAVIIAMQAVNIRTGRPENWRMEEASGQKFWAKNPPLWIDGYVPRDAKAVRQFLPLRGDETIARYDVALHAGVSASDPFIDSLTMAVYLPNDLSSLEQKEYHGRGFTDEGLELYSPPMKGARPRALSMAAPVEKVGMGAGARMRQSHPLQPGVKYSDYQSDPFMFLSLRFVWDDQFNKWARELDADEQIITFKMLERLQARQKQYADMIWAYVGTGNEDSDVDELPVIN